MAKIQPTVLSVTVDLKDGTNYYDSGQVLSAINRRMYRQGKMYYLASVDIEVATANTGGYDLSMITIPDTWVTRNAWFKAFKLWQEMQEPVLDESPSVKAKWRDFKVYFDAAHADLGRTSGGMEGVNLKAQGLTGPIADGEWNDSTMVPPETENHTAGQTEVDKFTLHMLGADSGGPLPDANLNSGAIIQMYAETRAYQEPGAALFPNIEKSWGLLLNQRDQASSEDLIEVVTAENDNPPYDADVYPGMTGSGLETGLEVWGANIGAQGNEQILSAQGFAMPLGLLKIVVSKVGGSFSDGDVRLKLNYIPGMDKGILTSEVRQ